MKLFHVASHTDWKVKAGTDDNGDPLQMETKTDDDKFAKLQNVLSHQKDTAKKVLDLENKGVAVEEDIGWHADSEDFCVKERSEEMAENETTQETSNNNKDWKPCEYKIHFDPSRQNLKTLWDVLLYQLRGLLILLGDG